MKAIFFGNFKILLEGERERTGQINMQKAGSKIYAKLNNELATHYK